MPEIVRPQKEDTSLVERVPSFFDRLAILDLDGERKAATAKQIIEETTDIGIAYRSQMILSVVIATFGLMIDATAVVIWAMLIAPIMRPLQGIAFSTTTWNKRIFIKSFWLLFVSILLGVFVSVLFTLVIPPFHLSNEILSRTEPTLIDLWIALASWVIAFLAFGYDRIQSSLAWVAMAAALVPPIWVIGIGIGLLNWQIARGSFLLFVTNLVAIIITWVVIFYLFGFYPNQQDDKKRSLRNMIWALGLLWLLCIPLANSLIDITKSIKESILVEQTIEQYLATNTPDTKLIISSIDPASITISLQSPPEYIPTELQKSELTSLLAETLGREVEVDLSITPIYMATPLEALQPSPFHQVQQHILWFLETNYPTVSLIQLQLTNDERILLADFHTSQRFDTIRFRTLLSKSLQSVDSPPDTLLIEWLDSPTPVADLDQRTRTIQWVFTDMVSDSKLQSLSVFGDLENEALEISLWVSSSLDPDELSTQLIDYQKNLVEIFQTPVVIIPKVHFYEEIELGGWRSSE